MDSTQSSIWSKHKDSWFFCRTGVGIFDQARLVAGRGPEEEMK